MKTLNPLYISMLMASTLLTACGGGGGSGGGDSAAPVATIQFPAEESMTDFPIITVRGTAKDAAGSTITSVKVNGVDVTSNDGFATWQVTLPLEVGTNTLQVATVDAKGNSVSAADTAIVHARPFPFLSDPGEDGVVVDAANNRILVLESLFQSAALYAFDLTTGERTVISSIAAVDNLLNTEAVGGGAGLQFPTRLQLDTANNRILLTDSLNQTIVVIDLTTGERTVILAKATPGGSGPAFNLLRSALLDADNNRLLIMDGFNGAMRLFTVNLTTKVRSIRSSSSVGSGPGLNVSEPMALDSANNRLLVADSSGGKGVLLAINLANGNRTVLSGFNSQNSTTVGEGKLFRAPVSIRFDSDRNEVLIADAGTESLYMVDLGTGTRTLLSGTDPDTQQPVGTGPAFADLQGADFLGDHQAVVLDDDMETTFIVDLQTGERQFLPANAIGSGPRLETPRAFALQNNRLLVADSELNALMSINTKNGDRSVFLAGETAGLVNPVAMVLNASGKKAFLLDNVDNDPRLVSLDLSSQQVTVISSLNGADPIGSGPDMSNPVQMVLDAAHNRMLVLDSSLDSIFAVTLDSGERTVISGTDPDTDTTIGTGNDFSSPATLALSTDGNTAYVTDDGSAKLIAIDIATGNRTDVTVQNFKLQDATSMVVNKAGDRVLIGNVDDETIVTVELASGTVTVLSGFDNDADELKGVGPSLDEPVSIIEDTANNRLLVLDAAVRGVFAIDLVTGDRVITSWTDISPQNNLF